ncbi:transglycosylase domain-containing protein [Candidatus Nomurabacteria bacterium]|nr:transglycosylase domain-containing protein [Candidatus Nomurabacteria bacterium]
MKYNLGISDSSKNRKSKKRSGYGKTPKSFQLSSASINRNSSRSSSKRRNYLKFSKFAPFKSVGIHSGSKRHEGVASNKLNRTQRFKAFLKKAFGISIAIGFLLGLISVIALGIYLQNLEKSLPDPDKLVAWNADETTIIYDRNGKELYKIFDEENREFASIDEIPENTKWALLAAEDVEFYQHKGLDWKGIVRCGFQSVNSYLQVGNSSEGCGASTITQQLVRNTIMYQVYGSEAYERSSFFKTVRRKFRELLVSMQVEQALTKDQILQLYMNEINLGGNNYGYGAAAKSYFGKDVSELNLAESAMLAGIVQQPSIASPLYGIDPEVGKERQQYVFDQMLKYKKLTGVTEDEVNDARNTVLEYKAATSDIPAYHFVFYVKQLLEEKYTPEVVQKGGLRVTTTLDLSTQKIAEEELRKGIDAYGHPYGVMNGAMVVLNPKTNQILAMVGSVDPNKTDDPRIDGNVNITTSLRQMGSSFKPYVYLTAFQKYGPWIEAPDIKLDFGTYKPSNWDDKSYGLMVARQALIESRNIPANYTMQLVGIDPVLQTTEKVGITTLNDRQNYGLSLALGAGEMKLLEHAQGFSTFATGGIRRNVTPFMKVEDIDGNILEEYKKTPGKRIFDEKDVYLLNWVLCDLGGFGDQPFNYRYMIDGKRAMCGKTGTTNGPKDLISIQYHKNLLVAVWAGNNNNVETPGAWSTTVPLPIASSFMQRVAGKYKPELYTRPAGILSATVCNDTGRLASNDTMCKKVPTIYVQGRAPKKDEREVLQICKDSGKISTNVDEAKRFDLLEEKTYLNFSIENSQQQSSYNNYFLKDKKSDILVKKPDSADCELPLGPHGEPVVEITSPEDGIKITAGDKILVKTDARAKGSVEYVELLFNNNLIDGSQDDSAPYNMNLTIPKDTPTGTYTLTARAVDNNNKEGTASISIEVEGKAASATVELSDPVAGSTISLPYDLVAQVNSFDPDRVIFAISGVDNPSYSKSFTDTDGSDGWSVSWDDGASAGTYSITISAVQDGVDIVQSDPATVIIAEPEPTP